MTEREFGQRVDAAAERLEQRIEAAADRLDRGLTRAWDGNKGFRRTAKAVSLAAEAGLIWGALRLAGRGHKGAAICCFALGAAGMAAAVLQAVLFEKE